jgi:hypothetical protein
MCAFHIGVEIKVLVFAHKKILDLLFSLQTVHKKACRMDYDLLRRKRKKFF